MDLFEHASRKDEATLAPLAERMRPTRLEEFVGQEHLTGEGRFGREGHSCSHRCRTLGDRISAVTVLGLTHRGLRRLGTRTGSGLLAGREALLRRGLRADRGSPV